MKNKTLKVVVSIALILVSVFAFCSCSKGNETAKNQKTDNEQDLIAIEQLWVKPKKNSQSCDIRFKVRNLSEEDVDYISFDIQVLDKNGDAVATTSAAAEHVESGQAVTPEGWFQIDCTYDQIDSIKIKNYGFLESNGNGTYSNETSYTLKNPIVLKYSGETEPDSFSQTGESYIWKPVE